MRTNHKDNGAMNTFTMPAKGVTTPLKEKSGQKDVFLEECREMGQVKGR